MSNKRNDAEIAALHERITKNADLAKRAQSKQDTLARFCGGSVAIAIGAPLFLGPMMHMTGISDAIDSTSATTVQYAIVVASVLVAIFSWIGSLTNGGTIAAYQADTALAERRLRQLEDDGNSPTSNPAEEDSPHSTQDTCAH